MGRHLVLVGGGHAHLTLLLRLRDIVRNGHRVTLVSPFPYHYYSGMGPGMLSGRYRPQDARFNLRHMAENGGAEVIAARAVRVDAVRRRIQLSNGRVVPFDVASFNTGSHVPIGWTGGGLERLVPVKPVLNLYLARLELLERLRTESMNLLVVGGGAAGVEVAGNLWRLVRDGCGEARITLVAGSRLLPGAPPRARELARRSLERRGIELLEGVRFRSFRGKDALLSDGRGLACDLAFIGVGVEPSSLFKLSDLPTGPGGELLVDRTLRSTAFPQLLGGGDCVAVEGLSLPKVGVYAVRQNRVLHHNVLASLEGSPCIPFKAGGPPLLILNMGDGTGILWKRGITLAGKAAFWLKEIIDLRFMHRFQVSGEREEPEFLPTPSGIERKTEPWLRPPESTDQQ